MNYVEFERKNNTTLVFILSACTKSFMTDPLNNILLLFRFRFMNTRLRV